MKRELLFSIPLLIWAGTVLADPSFIPPKVMDVPANTSTPQTYTSSPPEKAITTLKNTEKPIKLDLASRPAFLTALHLAQGKVNPLVCPKIVFSPVPLNRNFLGKPEVYDLVSYIEKSPHILSAFSLTPQNAGPEAVETVLLSVIARDPVALHLWHRAITEYSHPSFLSLSEIAPGLCDPFVKYLYPRKPAIPPTSLFWQPAPPLRIDPTKIPISIYEYLNNILNKYTQQAFKTELDLYGAISQRLVSTYESLFGSISSYTPQLTFEKGGKIAKVSLNLELTLNRYSVMIYQFRKNHETSNLQRLLYVFLTGYRDKSIKYTDNPLLNSLINLDLLSRLSLLYGSAFYIPEDPAGYKPDYVPDYFVVKSGDYEPKIFFWHSNPFSARLLPEPHPLLTQWLNTRLITYHPPINVLDTMVFVYMIQNHDTLADTVFTDFLFSMVSDSDFKWWDEKKEREMSLWLKDFTRELLELQEKWKKQGISTADREGTQRKVEERWQRARQRAREVEESLFNK